MQQDVQKVEQAVDLPRESLDPPRAEAPVPISPPTTTEGAAAENVNAERPQSDAGDDEDERCGVPELANVGSGWTIPLLCAGIALIAACMIIPAADENRRLVYEREKLERDLEQIDQQLHINNQFIKRVANDPNLFERLAQRQMKMVREGTSVLDLGSATSHEMSPYELVHVPPPGPLPPYKPLGGRLAELCRNPRHNLYLTGGGLLLIASGLILGASSRQD
jgi:hypothetical protein